MKRILRKIHNAVHPIIGEIWCLHRVIENRSHFRSLNELEITPCYFEFLIEKHLKQGYRFIDIDSFISFSNKPSLRRNQKIISISFDDGYKDILTNAYPILQKHQIPFTIYITTSFLDKNADLWWNQLENIAQHTEIDIDALTAEIYKSSTHTLAEEMHRKTNTQPNYGLCNDLCLTWDDLELFDKKLCTIGSHGVTHTPLTQLDENEVRFELQTSKLKLEKHLNQPIQHFSYPHSFFNERTNNLVKESGYKSAVIGYGGHIRYNDKLLPLFRKNIIQP